MALRAGPKTHTDNKSSPPPERFIQKVENLTPANTKGVNWDKSRVVTPGEICGLKGSQEIKLVRFDNKGVVILFRSGLDSQGLSTEQGDVTAASVSTKIKTPTKRDNETKKTHIQYEKNRIDQVGADFQVAPKNHRNRANYEGGHLIDHQFSAGTSHTFENNYIPQLQHYNNSFKNYLVNRCDAYIEIPLYTPHPPKIGIRGKKKQFHPIPIGIIFVQVKSKKFLAAYYFPNNQFDYEALNVKLGLKKGSKAKEIVPYFKLKQDLLRLLAPAIIIDLTNVEDGESKQEKIETKFFELTDDITVGMSLAEYSDDLNPIEKLVFSLLKQKKTRLDLFLAYSKSKLKLIDCSASREAFKVLGEFLIKYPLSNARKSEVLCMHSRLLLLSSVVRYLELSQIKSEDSLLFIDNELEPVFTAALEELESLVASMELFELFFFANIYQRLSNEDIHGFIEETNNEWEVLDDDLFCHYFEKHVEKLSQIKKTYDIKKFKGEDAKRWLLHVFDAKTSGDFIASDLPNNNVAVAAKKLGVFRKDSVRLLNKFLNHASTSKMRSQSDIDFCQLVGVDENLFKLTIRSLGEHEVDTEFLSDDE